MSMNLHCKEVDLWQTPTDMTYMIYSNKDGGSAGILYRYKIWVESHAPRIIRGKEEQEEANRIQESIRNHLQKIDNAVKLKKRLHFFVM